MTYFVSGHRDLTQEEFEEHYVPLINFIVAEDFYSKFVVGDWEGCDNMFIQYMEDNHTDIPIDIYYVDILRVRTGNYNSYRLLKCDNYDECDASMTKYSTFDIAWIRPGKEDSHTAKNIKRRYGFQRNQITYF